MISIDRIRVSNLLFAERDYYLELYDNCTKIKSIQGKVIITQDSTALQLEAKITNLNSIIYSSDKILQLERDKLVAIENKHKKSKILIIGGAAIVIILCLL